MPTANVAARFDSPEALEAALSDLRRLGAVRCADLKAAKISCDDVIAFAAEKAEELLK